MFTDFPQSPYRVPYDGTFRIASAKTQPRKSKRDKKTDEKKLEKLQAELMDLQRILYAHDRHSLLLVFQAMDAAGKDSTIRAVMQGVNPAGCQVYSFKAPSAEEIDHDFLWRTAKRLPERGRIGIFNRSYYEEVLVVRVHQGFLSNQRLPADVALDSIWDDRYESIRDHEKHLARNGTVILKFWLNVSRNEQRDRFIDRIDQPDKNWKFSPGDVEERRHWTEYMEAYQDALNATSRQCAPWYAIPADKKSYMRATVAEIIVDTLKAMGLKFPKVSREERAQFRSLRDGLLAED